jgi:hypothetical protein
VVGAKSVDSDTCWEVISVKDQERQTIQLSKNDNNSSNCWNWSSGPQKAALLSGNCKPGYYFNPNPWSVNSKDVRQTCTGQNAHRRSCQLTAPRTGTGMPLMADTTGSGNQASMRM